MFVTDNANLREKNFHQSFGCKNFDDKQNPCRRNFAKYDDLVPVNVLVDFN